MICFGGINEYTDKMYSKFQEITANFNFDRIKLPEQITSVVQGSLQDVVGNTTKVVSNLLNTIIKWLTSLPALGIYIVVTLMATYIIFQKLG